MKARVKIGIFIAILLLVSLGAYTAFASTFSFSYLRPSAGSTILTTSTEVRAYVKAGANLDRYSAKVTISDEDGQNSVTYNASFKYYYSYRDGFISYTVPNLKDGVRRVTVSIKDINGNVGSHSWLFTVQVPPVISELYPANNSSFTTVNLIRAKAVDPNGTINAAKILMKVDGVEVVPAYDPATGYITYEPSGLSGGSHSVYLYVEDGYGYSATASWAFNTTASPPQFKDMAPANGTTVTVGDPDIKVNIEASNDIVKESVKLYINNVLQPGAKFAYRQYYNTSWQLVTDYQKGTLTFKPVALAKGTHTVRVEAADKVGNAGQQSWSFTVNALPKILEISPAPSHVSVTRPIVDIDLYSNDELTDVRLSVQYGVYAPQNVTLTKTVLGTNKTRYSYQTIEPWEMDSTILLQLKATNASGTLTHDWKYTVSRFPDMSVSNTSCALCHNTVEIKKQKCGSCHSTSIDSWQSKCFTCHLTGPPPKNHHSYSTYPHDIPAAHTLGLSDLVACRNCHSQTLTRTHNLNSLTCASCHDNKPVVSTASLIDALNLFKRGRVLWTVSGVNRRIDDNKRCFTCHTGAQTVTRHMEHRVSHTGACVECHGTGMTTTGAGITGHQDDCLSCHASTNPSVRQAIELQKNSCIDCHTQPHGVYMASLRDDIPLYSGNGVTWSIPQDASIWADDGWLPAELNSSAAKIVFSSRSSVDKATIRDYYKVAMESAGWTQIGSTYSESNNYFQLTYQKSKRYCVIWYYSGDVPNEPGTNAQGARLQVAYH